MTASPTRRALPRRLAAGALAAAAVAAPSLVLASAASAAPSTTVVISQFRFRGPQGGNDEFVELLNVSKSPVALGGYKLLGCDATANPPTERATVPAGFVLAPGQHYLFANAQDGTAISPGYSSSPAGDQTYSLGIIDQGGARLVDAAGATVDGVGSKDGNNVCREGAGLPIPSFQPVLADNSFTRKNGGTQDTDVNADDFTGPGAGAPASSTSSLAAAVAEFGVPSALVLGAIGVGGVVLVRRRRAAGVAAGA